MGGGGAEIRAVAGLVWHLAPGQQKRRAQVLDRLAARRSADVHRLAQQYRLTSDAAAYLALARELNLPLVTFEDELRAAAPAAGVTVLIIQDSSKSSRRSIPVS
jgi:hypothetical protein